MANGGRKIYLKTIFVEIAFFFLDIIHSLKIDLVSYIVLTKSGSLQILTS